MVIRDGLKYGVEQLQGVQTAVLDTQLIMCHVMGIDKLKMIINGDMPLTRTEEKKFSELIMRRKEGEPVQYILGKCEFMGLDFEVNPSVLIPRPDTEIIVEAVLERMDKGHILEIGSGSGCIPVSIAYYNKHITALSIDISHDATHTAKRNAEKNGVAGRVKFITADVFDGVDGVFDAVVSNPPYVETVVIPTLQPEVQREPSIALDGGADGLDFYRYITKTAPDNLREGGLLAFEVGHTQADSVADMMKKDFTKIEKIKDLAGIERVVLGYKREG